MNHRLQFRCSSVGFLCVLALALAPDLTPNASAQTVSITNVSVPGSATVWVSALNQSGQLAGVFTTSAGVSRTFLWSPGSLFDIGSLGGGSAEASTLNNVGQVVGQSTTVAGETHAFVFNAGVMSDIGPAGIPMSSGIAINDAGQVAGYYVNGTLQHAFVASGGTLTDLGTLGGSFSSPVGINSFGQVAGDSTDVNGRRHAFRFSNGVMLDLGTLGGVGSFSTALNNAGYVTGMGSASDGSMHAFVHNGMGMVDLGTLGGSFSIGYSINQSGHVSGDSSVAGDVETHAFFHNGTTMLDLGTLGGTYSTPLALNNLDQVVGIAGDSSDADRAFLFQNGAMVDLNSMLPPASGWFLDAAYYINDNGQIVGTGTYNGQSAWFLLTIIARSNQAPVAVAGPSQTFHCAGTATAVVLDGTGSSDPDGDTLTYEWRSGSMLLGTTPTVTVAAALGVTTFTLRVTDPQGAVAEDTVSVSLVDNQPPVVRCPANDTARANDRGQAAVPNFLFAASISDSCTPDVLLVKSQNPPVGTMVGVGTTTVVLSATDTSGNSSSCTVTFTVEGAPVDTTPPVVACPQAVSVCVGSEGLATVPNLLERLVASDNVTPAGSLIKTQSPAAGTRVRRGTYVVTITVTDAAGNSTVCSTPLTAVDKQAPTILSVTASVVNLNPVNHKMVPVTLTVSARDNSDSNPVSRIVSVASNEPVTGEPDWQVTGPLTVNLRAENDSKQSPRVYTITVDCSDVSGNHSRAIVHVVASKQGGGDNGKQVGNGNGKH